MVGIVKEIDGQKKIVPLTTDTGTGAAVGTLVTQYKKVPMSGYLYCDGSTFDENDYPALYMYLGTNVLPDYSNSVENGYVYIKATSGLAENQQENVLNDVKGYVDNSNSYYTNEVKTGGKWIDGKPIYRKTLVFTNLTLTDSPTHIGITDIPINNIIRTEELVLCKNVALAGSGNEAVYTDYRGYIYAFQKVSSTTTGWEVYYTIEYTKTTD